MAFNSAFMLPLIVIWLFFQSPSSALNIQIRLSDKLASALCKDTVNPEICKTTLENFTRSEAADMQELGVTAVLLATEQARFNKDYIDYLLQNEKDSVTKNDLLNCRSDYSVTLGKLRQAFRLSDKKDYKGMVKSVNDAMTMTKKCEHRFEEPPSRPSPLKDDNQKMVWLNDIALVTLNLDVITSFKTI